MHPYFPFSMHSYFPNSQHICFLVTTIVKENIKHRADVFTAKSICIEFQNSVITSETIRDRENFYEKMVWVINGEKFKNNISWHCYELDHQFLKYKPSFIENYKPNGYKLERPSFVYKDFNLAVQTNEVIIAGEFDFDCISEHFWLSLSNLTPMEVKDLEERFNTIIVKKYEIAEKPASIEIYNVSFSWSRMRKVWGDAKSPIFIDLGNDLLFVENGEVLSESFWGICEGKIVKMETFLRKYLH